MALHFLKLQKPWKTFFKVVSLGWVEFPNLAIFSWRSKKSLTVVNLLVFDFLRKWIWFDSAGSVFYSGWQNWIRGSAYFLTIKLFSLTDNEGSVSSNFALRQQYMRLSLYSDYVSLFLPLQSLPRLIVPPNLSHYQATLEWYCLLG